MPLPALAGKIGCSQRDLEARFARAFGATPRKVYTHIRLTVAHRLVTETPLSIAEIAGRTGYEDASAFTRAFRREFGEAPRMLRSR